LLIFADFRRRHVIFFDDEAIDISLSAISRRPHDIGFSFIFAQSAFGATMIIVIFSRFH
jgi:hypothetical protein